jgi:predicted TIM-barrel fold metal-dependent hydrolase
MIDANVHITEDGKWFSSSLNASVNELIHQMQVSGVKKSILVPFEGIASNKYILSVAEKDPAKFIPACSLNPINFNSKLHVLKELKGLREEGFRIIKLHNRLHKYYPLDEKVLWLYEANEMLDKPLIIFVCGIIYDKNVKGDFSTAQLFHKISSSFPRLKIVIMHGGGTHVLQVYEAIKDNQNMYLDLSFVINKYKGSSLDLDIKFLLNNFDRRLIWGSDFPEFSQADSLSAFYHLCKEVSQGKIDRILHQNIIDILSSNE